MVYHQYPSVSIPQKVTMIIVREKERIKQVFISSRECDVITTIIRIVVKLQEHIDSRDGCCFQEKKEKWCLVFMFCIINRCKTSKTKRQLLVFPASPPHDHHHILLLFSLLILFKHRFIFYVLLLLYRLSAPKVLFIYESSEYNKRHVHSLMCIKMMMFCKTNNHFLFRQMMMMSERKIRMAFMSIRLSTMTILSSDISEGGLCPLLMAHMMIACEERQKRENNFWMTRKKIMKRKGEVRKKPPSTPHDLSIWSSPENDVYFPVSVSESDVDINFWISCPLIQIKFLSNHGMQTMHVMMTGRREMHPTGDHMIFSASWCVIYSLHQQKGEEKITSGHNIMVHFDWCRKKRIKRKRRGGMRLRSSFSRPLITIIIWITRGKYQWKWNLLVSSLFATTANHLVSSDVCILIFCTIRMFSSFGYYLCDSLPLSLLIVFLSSPDDQRVLDDDD